MGIEIAQVKTIEELLPARGPYIYPAGINDSYKSFSKYGPKSSDQPNLMIINPIYDLDGNTIMPGYYELLLSEDRQILILTQSQKIIATFPVFKLEEDKNQMQATQPMDKKSLRKSQKEQTKKEKQNKKLIREGKMAEEPEIYTNATLEYDVEGEYYLVKYERGRIRAWGVLKN
ncbi:MAG: hypothetical protein WCG95_06085 [bacterium]